MPNDKLTPTKKDELRKQFMQTLAYVLEDPKKMAQAISDAQFAQVKDANSEWHVWKPRAEKEWTESELTQAAQKLPAILDSINGASAQVQYRISPSNVNRVKDELLKAGFTQEQITQMRPADVLQSAAALAYVKDEIFNSGFKPYLEKHGMELEDGYIEDMRYFLDHELPEAAKPAIAGQFLPKRDSLQLLEDTLRSDTENTNALGRLLLAMNEGTLTVNGQKPDESYPLGEYLIHGGRVKFDLTELTDTEQEEFFQLITNNQAQQRGFATHYASGIDANGSPAEGKSGLLGAVADGFRALVGASKHYGINLPVGGTHQVNREGLPESYGKTPDESGEWGHLYVHKDSDILLFGIEASAPGKTNQRTGESHSITGGSGEFSTFLAHKINSKALRDAQKGEGKTPLSTKEKNNWATVKITHDQFKQLKKSLRTNPDYVSLVRTIPMNAEAARPDRMQKMQAWAKATKQGNKMPLAAKILSGALITAGILIAVLPIPGIAQAVGGTMAAIGFGLITAAVGGIAGFLFRKPSKTPQQLWAKSEAQIEREQSQSVRNPLFEDPGIDAQELLIDSTSKIMQATHDQSPGPQPGGRRSQSPVVDPDQKQTDNHSRSDDFGSEKMPPIPRDDEIVEEDERRNYMGY